MDQFPFIARQSIPFESGPVMSDMSMPSGEKGTAEISSVVATILLIFIWIGFIALIWAFIRGLANAKDEEDDDKKRKKALKKQQVREFYQNPEMVQELLFSLNLA